MKAVFFLLVIAFVQFICAEWELFPHYDDQAVADIRSMFVEEGAEAMTQEELDAEAETFGELSEESQDFIDAMDAITQRELNEIYSSASCAKVCPAGKKPVANNKVSGTNGCGADGTSFVTKLFNKALNGISPASFTACCNVHDKGYGTCGGVTDAGRAVADRQFLSCLTAAVASIYKKKNAMTTTEKIAVNLNLHKVFYTAVAKFGCGPYKAGQEANCDCK